MRKILIVPAFLLVTTVNLFLGKKPHHDPAAGNNAAPNFEVLDVQPASNGDVVYLTCAPRSSKGSISALLSVWFKIKNKEGQKLNLSKVVYSWSGNNNNGEKVFTGDAVKDKSVGANSSLSWQNSRTYHELGNVIELTFPFPKQLSIKVYFEGFTSPYVISRTLKAHTNSAAYIFPAKEADLGLNEYWYGDAAHGGGSQVFSYDIVAIGWDSEAKKWSEKYPGKSGDKNEHYRCFGKPVYAITDGEVVHFNDKIKDNEPGVDTDGGGNTFHIKSGNELIRYYHLKQYSLNKEFMKIGAKVKKGDWLARVGSTATAGTHLHIDVVSANPDPVLAFPLQFSNAYVISADNYKEPDPSASWTKMNKTGLPYVENGRSFIWPGDKPTWYPGGWPEVARHGIPESSYQGEFTKIWSSGYYPVWVDAYDVNGKTYFNTIFRYNTNNYEVAVRHDMTTESYQKEYDVWVKQKGFRLQQLDNYLDAGKLKFAAIFIKKPGAPQAQPAYHAQSPEEHQKLFEKFSKDGYVPVNVSVTSVNGKRYYSAFYEKRNVGGITLKSYLTQQEYQDMFEDMAKKGWEQVYINAYHHDGKTRFSVIWYEKSGYSNGSATRKSSSDDYQEKYDANTGKGQLTRCVTGYDEGGKHWFAAHWAK